MSLEFPENHKRCSWIFTFERVSVLSIYNGILLQNNFVKPGYQPPPANSKTYLCALHPASSPLSTVRWVVGAGHSAPFSLSAQSCTLRPPTLLHEGVFWYPAWNNKFRGGQRLTIGKAAFFCGEKTLIVFLTNHFVNKFGQIFCQQKKYARSLNWKKKMNKRNEIYSPNKFVQLWNQFSNWNDTIKLK